MEDIRFSLSPSSKCHTLLLNILLCVNLMYKYVQVRLEIISNWFRNLNKYSDFLLFQCMHHNIMPILHYCLNGITSTSQSSVSMKIRVKKVSSVNENMINITLVWTQKLETIYG